MSNAPTTGEGPEALGSSSPKSEDTHRAADGLVVVPREPTDEMMRAAYATNEPFYPRAVWSAMIAATQQPAGEGDDGDPAPWAVAAERAASEAYASNMGDPDGHDDTHAARMDAARAIEAHARAALSATQQPVCEGEK